MARNIHFLKKMYEVLNSNGYDLNQYINAFKIGKELDISDEDTFRIVESLKASKEIQSYAQSNMDVGEGYDLSLGIPKGLEYLENSIKFTEKGITAVHKEEDKETNNSLLIHTKNLK